MSNSLSVLKLNNLCSELKEGKSIILNNQKTFVDWDGGSKECFMPQTTIKQKNIDENFIHYSVNSSSNLVNESIYVYWDQLENFVEYTKGYSTILDFELLIDINYKNLYIFAPKKVAEKFSKQIIKEQKVSCTNISFDFYRILELENLVAAWGVWEDSRGAITKTARFGPDITTELSKDEYSSITTMYINYMFGRDVVQLVLNKEGRIATQNKLKNEQMLSIFQDISDILIETESRKSIKKHRIRKNKTKNFSDYF